MKAYKKQAQSKRRPEKTDQTPSEGKVSLTGMKFQVFGSQVLEKFLPFTGFRLVLYIGILGTVICPITSPRFVEANESGVNFLNGY